MKQIGLITAAVIVTALGNQPVHARDGAPDAQVANNLGATTALAAQAAGGPYRDEAAQRRNILIGAAAVAVGVALAAGAFDSDSSHQPPIDSPATHDGG